MSQEIPKKNSAMVSINQIACGTWKMLNGISAINDAIIPIPHTRKIMFRFFLLGVGIPAPLVNWNSEFHDRIPKKPIADIM